VQLLSTGGTAKAIREAGLAVTDVSEFTGSPEVMDGRVKTLHPRVHGGILMRDTEGDRAELASLGGEPIELVIVNLYPFGATVAKGAPFADCIENIDIGGPTMVRAAAKNHSRVTVVVEPSDYAEIAATLPAGPDEALRQRLALKAFCHTATYDAAIAEWMQGQLGESRTAVHTLKYGCNPQQKPASVAGLISAQGPKPLPFDVLCGTPGYINLLDALNAWQLVRELAGVTGLPAAASFKHCSPAGAAVYAEIDEDMLQVYEAAGKTLSKTCIAYLRSRQADPLCSFGDFVAVSEVVDVSTAMLLKIEVSDGIIAAGYEPEALAILKAKKGGKYIVLQADPAFEPPEMEERTVFGAKFKQRRALEPVGAETLANVVTAKKELSDAAKRDLLVAQVAIKYTQSNSVGYAKDGQMVGVGAGQQSRVDCVKLAGRKVETWYLRQHPKVRAHTHARTRARTHAHTHTRTHAHTHTLAHAHAHMRASLDARSCVHACMHMRASLDADSRMRCVQVRALKFKEGVKRQERINARVRYIEGDMTSVELAEWSKQFDEVPEPLALSDKAEFLKTLTGVSLASDAFFPFRDSIDVASQRGVEFLVAAGGSVADPEVIAAADGYGMTMAFSGLRLFHH